MFRLLYTNLHFLDWLLQTDHLLTLLAANNPMRRGPVFLAIVPSGNLAVFDDRWLWIIDSQEGMYPMWSGTSSSYLRYDAASRKSTEEIEMRQASAIYSKTGQLPP